MFGGGGGGVVGAFALIFAGYVPLISENRCPIGVYFGASYWPRLSQGVVFAIPTWSTVFMLLLFNGDHFESLLTKMFLTRNSENVRPHSSHCVQKCNPVIVNPVVEMRPLRAAHPY